MCRGRNDVLDVKRGGGEDKVEGGKRGLGTGAVEVENGGMKCVL